MSIIKEFSKFIESDWKILPIKEKIALSIVSLVAIIVFALFAFILIQFMLTSLLASICIIVASAFIWAIITLTTNMFKE